MYAKELTKKYLKKLGITNVTEDGKIFSGEKELKQIFGTDGYLKVNVYDKELYKILYPVTKDRSSGQFTLPVQRVVYAWFFERVPNNLVVDHKNNDKTDNRVTNLQLLTPSENIWKDREHNVYLMKCKYRPREWYEDKLNDYLEKYEEAKLNKDANLAHKLRAYISQYRAKLRFWDQYYTEK